MSEHSRIRKSLLRIAPLLGAGLLAYLFATTRLSAVIANAKVIGWGMLLVIALGGLSHIVKTWAWRLTLQADARKVSFRRSLSLRLISEAIGQFGFIGMVGGEAARASLLGAGIPAATAISSVALDRSLFIFAGVAVTVSGIAALAISSSLSHALAWSAGILALALVSILFAGVMAIRRRWPVFSAPARAAARVPWFRNMLRRQEATLKTAEQRVLDFYHHAPGAFWFSVLLNFVCHFLAVLEVYVIVRLLGAPTTLLGALILESLTKLINVAGAVNPGNVGTYEGGTMVIGRLVRLTGPQGLLLALARRVRAVFWAIIGGVCLMWFSGKPKRDALPTDRPSEARNSTMPTEDCCRSISLCETVFILAHDIPRLGQFEPALVKIATVPIFLRAILGVRGKERIRTVVVLNPITGPRIRAELLSTGRLPANIEWMEAYAGASFSTILREAGLNGGRVVFIMGGRTYRPDLLRILHEWRGEGGAVEFICSGKPIGLFALASEFAAEIAADSGSGVVNELDLHQWIAANVKTSVVGLSPCREIGEESWQAITRPEDCIAAERKLDSWLVKPTDGVFARMNRQFSIPISRRLLSTPVTANMVSLFTLALSLVAAGFFALGGYWFCLTGAIMGVWTSILDGCDGEIARLKLQVTDLGCWLDTLCDYLYYFVTFAGMTIGLIRATHDSSFIVCGFAVLFGAVLTFITAAVGRKRLSGNRPEKYLEIWQKNAERRSSGLLVRMARYTEFIVRRCFLPYLLLAFALCNLTGLVLYMAALGANVAWIINLRSLIAFSRTRNAAATGASASRQESAPLTVQP